MPRKTFRLALATLFILSVSVAIASADSAADSFQKGKEHLKQGQLKSAMYAFASAAKADRTNKQYMIQFMQTRQAFAIKNRMPVEKNLQKRERMATFLHAFYLQNDCLDSALALDKKIHEKSASAISGLRLAETQLALKQNAEAAKTLADLSSEAKKSDWAVDAFHAIALARAGKTDEAKKVAAATKFPADLKSGRAFLAACVETIKGKNDTAIAMLTKAFQTTPPSRLDALKAEAKTSPEMASLASTDAFATALKTESKVPESSCSGGSSCATCPHRAKCQGKSGSSTPATK